MATRFLSDVDFTSTARLPRKSTPASPITGEAWVEGINLKYRDNAGGPATQIVEIQSRRNVANGYAGLDAGSLILGTQIPYGATANTAAQGNDSRLVAVANATASATAGMLVLRDGSGRAQFADPSAAADAATKGYVDNAIAGLDAKVSVRAATTANITLSGAQTVDAVSLIAGDRCLVKSQTLPEENGIYLVASGAWTRATDADTWAEIPSAYVWVEEGSSNGDTGWVTTADAGGTLGTTAMPWVQFSAATEVSAGNVGGSGLGVFKQKNGTVLEFYKVASISTPLTVALNTNVIEFALAIGSGAGTLCAGNDSRLSDARTPTAHAATHGTAGTDPVSLDASQIVSGTFAVARLPIMVGATSGVAGTVGAVPQPAAGFEGRFLRGDATWATAVTSVALALPAIFSISGSPVTTTGTLTATLATQSANLVWAGPTTGAAAAPTFRALDPLDIPNLSAAKITSGLLAVARGGTGVDASAASNGFLLIGNGSGFALAGLSAGTGISYTLGAGSIQINNTGVTSVALSLPAFLSVSGSPVTTTGTLTATLATQAANTHFCGPVTGAAAAPTFRLIAKEDLVSALTTPPPIGGTTPDTAAFTTLGASGIVTFTNSDAAISTVTGALRVPNGGISTGGSLFTGIDINAGAKLVVNSTIDATSLTSASAVIKGGLAVAKSLIIGSVTAPAVPVDGQIWNDSTQKTLISYSAGIKQSEVGCLFTITADAAVTNTVTETTIFGTGVGSKTLPANFWVPGKSITLRCIGRFSRNSGTLRIRAKHGSVLLGDTGTSSPSNVTDGYFDVLVTITCRTTGVSGTLMAQGRFLWRGANGSNVGQYDMANAAAITVDTTAAATLDITNEWSAAATQNSMTGTNGDVIVLN